MNRISYARETLRILLLMVLIGLILCADMSRAGELVCGIATGFPPYQFERAGQVSGFDADIMRMVADRAGLTCRFHQDKWDDIVGLLSVGAIGCVTGMEINSFRKKFYVFTTPYYQRYDVVFVRADNTAANTVQDLYGKVITGDRHSFVESYWQEIGIIGRIRIRQTESKEASMNLLKTGRTVAAIIPKAVGFHLAGQMGFGVRVLDNPDPGSPVAIAVKKGNTELLVVLDDALRQLIDEGAVKRCYHDWFDATENQSRSHRN